MKLYIRSSIKTKLTVLIMAICAILLFVVGGVFLFSELFARQTTIKQQNKILATSLAEQVRHPLVLENFKQAEQLLQALSRQNNVHGCYLFDRNGKAVAEYLITDRTAIVLPALKHDFAKHEWPIIRHGELNFARNYYSSFTPIFFNGKQVGTLYLLSDLKAFYSGINGALIGFGMAFVVLIFLSFFLAGAMQKPVSDPLLKLAYLMKLISEKKDYTLRA
ncbi:MAG: hypothetical protein NWF06_05205, partial [Candidatus Bathyarchaeota archaeon]|nr:hypothetical protein [Candidatus Bathyarchaeum sp.]